MICLLVLLLVPVQTHFIETPHNITSTSPCTDRNHLFLAPGVLTAGGTSRACVSRFYPEGPARMLLSLHTEDGEVTTATRDLPPGDGGCLDINVPLKPNSKAELNVNLRYPEANCAWSARLSLRLAGGRLLALHTERARYRPGDTVRVRALALKADLTPAHGTIDEIWMEGPRGLWDGAIAAQWLRVRTRLGLAQIQYQLDEQAPPGKWLVKARLGDGSQGSATFSVGNYDLPPFQLTVRHAPRVLRSSERLVWTVCVRYPWSEAVEGMLVIRLRGAGSVPAGAAGAAGVRTAVRLRAPRACHRHAAAARRVGLGRGAPDVVVADFSFQEDGTRIWQNTTVVSQVVDDPVTLEFLAKYKSVISPGLPYKLKIKATRWDDKPAANERVRVCRTAATHVTSHGTSAANATCVDAVTDVRGVAAALFSPEENASPFYNFEARLNNASASLSVACGGAGGRAALGPLRPDARARALVPLYLDLGNVSAPLTVHFVVITRTGMIYRWGATTQCPVTTATSQIQTAPRNSECAGNDTPFNEIQKRNLSDMDALLDRHLLRVMLPIKVSNQMCPDSRVVAYFYHDNELVSASKHFEMEECFGNKVEASWVSRQVAPGSPATLQLSTPGPALCALSVLDTAAKWLQPGDSIRDVLMLALRRLVDTHRNLTEHDAAGECFLSTDTPELPTTSSGLLLGWLAAAGVRAAGGERVRVCDPAPAPAALLADDAFAVRSDFSEAWLWRLVPVGSNGTATATARAPDSITRFEASAYCLSRTGLAIAQPAVLQVFRDFFIHADGPRRLRRGDRSVVRYRLFNYLYTTLCVDIQILTDPHVEGGGAEERACVSGRAAAARRLELRARVPGEALVRVRAVAARNHTDGPPVSDEVLIKIQIDPEGVPVQEHKSIMLCASGTEGTSAPPAVSWSWPPAAAVPGTEALRLWAAGDVMGPLLADADALVALPRGCGEQNMARLATSLLALRLLAPAAAARALARDHVARGLTRQLQYAHPAGGFSAFGAADARPSTWLTAFCVRYLRRAHLAAWPGREAPPALPRAERWLRAQHMENGCFRNDGQLFHRDLTGGLGEEGEMASVVLTAYVVTSLLEGGAGAPAATLRSALACLRAAPAAPAGKPARAYAHAVLTYAFVRIARYEEELRRTNEAALLEKKGLEDEEETRYLVELLKIAKQSGDYVWWEGATLSSSIEATGYALLALAECPRPLRAHCAAAARAAALWLATHRQAAGGFVATQDTLVALEGLARWSSLQVPAANLTVSARGARHRAVTLAPGAKLPELIDLEPSAQLDIDVEGVGCALVQATRSYNTLCADGAGGAGCAGGAGGGRGALAVQVAVHTDGPFDCTANDTFCYCAAVIQACVVWAGPLPEMALLEVSLPGGYGADAARLYDQLHKADTLLRRIELTPSGGKATLYLSGGGEAGRGGQGGHRCYSVHAAGPRAATGPQHVTVFDYYAPHVEHTQMYVIPEDCPAAISHETDDYNPTDNLFTKAKSLNDDGEILITHEFSFEDIPDGVPLDDPMYENLTQKKGSGVDVNHNVKSKNYEKQSHDSTVIAFNTIGNPVNEMNKTINDLKQISVNEPVKENNITNGAAGATSDFFTASYNEIQNAETNIKSKIPISHSTEQVTEKSNIVQNVETTQNEKSDLKVAVDDVPNKVSAKYTVENTQENTQRVVETLKVNNPLLSEFHVIDSERDLDVPSGVEGPVPTVVLPPRDFVFVSPETGIPFTFTPDQESRRLFSRAPAAPGAHAAPARSEPFFQPYHNYRSYRPER